MARNNLGINSRCPSRDARKHLFNMTGTVAPPFCTGAIHCGLRWHWRCIGWSQLSTYTYFIVQFILVYYVHNFYLPSRILQRSPIQDTVCDCYCTVLSNSSSMSANCLAGVSIICGYIVTVDAVSLNQQQRHHRVP